MEIFLRENNIKVVGLQETKLRPQAADPSFADFALIRRDRPTGGGGGLAILVHHDVEFAPFDVSNLNDGVIEIQAVKLYLRNHPLCFYNIYVPPASSCPPNYSPNFEDIFDSADGDAIFVGDFNAHHSAWHSTSDDVRGEALVDAVDGSDYAFINLDAPTRLPSAGTSSSPDVSIASAHFAQHLQWSVPVSDNVNFSSSPLNSDHLPILISLSDPNHLPPPPPSVRSRKSFTNFRRANWTNFTSDLEGFLPATPPSSCAKGEKVLRNAVLKSSRRNIPAGFRHDFTPSLPPEAVPVRDRRDALRAANPHDPEIAVLERQMREICDKAKRDEFNEELASADGYACSSKFVNLVRRLSGKRVFRPPNQPIMFGASTCTKRRSIASRFNKQYTCIRKHESSPLTRRVLRGIRKKKMDHAYCPFSVEDTSEAIKRAKNSSAAGPDGLTMVHLKHFGPKALQFLTHLCNLSVQWAEMPAVWKKALILPVPKPGKPAEISTSYRPISLLCPASKILERLVLPLLSPSLSPAPTQHGFRPQHSTSTALLPLATRVASGFNQQKPPLRTATVAVDISKAFEGVDHNFLLQMISATDLHPNLVHWLSAYLRGRQSRVTWQGVTSTWRICRTGVPQGSVLGPILFNFFVSDCPVGQPSYADDFCISHSAVKIPDLERLLQADVDAFVDWAVSKKLVIAPTKCTVTLFTPDKARESNTHPRVYIDGRQIPLDKQPKILGVTFDTHFHFHAHAARVAKNCKKKLNILRALSGTSWGSSKEMMLQTWKTYVAPALNSAAPIWSPAASASSSGELQKVQNSAFRIASGCHKATLVPDLHMEVAEMPVDDHLKMLSAQYLASCLRESHPSHSVVTAPSGPRNMKPTLQSSHLATVAPFLRADGTLDPAEYNNTLKAIHTKSVKDVINRLGSQSVLGRIPPAISQSERTLNRQERTTLAQLRAGRCRRLNDYRHMLGQVENALCPECLFRRHTSFHLFNCDGRPTNLTVEDLWNNPVDVIQFLRSLPSFSFLLPPEQPHSPRPPPEPDP